MRPWGAHRLLSTISKPLNVLFFGSDQFSIHSLKGLDELKKQGYNVGKIQLVTRSPKWCGRQNSVLKYPPIVEAARNLNLPEPLFCDSRQDLIDLGLLVEDLHFNMIIAVSFGKLIPAELIKSVPLSLNVHPSLLPRYKGASPIQHALLNKDKTTGVTVQTLHPSKFDHGSIVAQTGPLEIEELLAKGTVSDFDSESPRKTSIMMDQLGLEGSRLLQRVITEELYTKMEDCTIDTTESSYAPKITTTMRRVDWKNQDAASLMNALEILGPLYTFKETQGRQKHHQPLKKRIILHEFQVSQRSMQLGQEPGSFALDQETENLLVMCRDFQCIEVTRIQFEGFKTESARQFITSLRKRCGKELDHRRIFL